MALTEIEWRPLGHSSGSFPFDKISKFSLNQGSEKVTSVNNFENLVNPMYSYFR